ncbi:hypothetical protein M0654_00555 [Rhizobium sp. NTR19]|uniref:DUF945 domain-containing protein n=1 Tax=Neorhizobium turbinariae TaxID=2937795 RepID=A0ABT0IKR9_9HYPH|nr:hypothetical protein [Neorhizobium turbinariae]MCK8778461.1 hypothetical protein [Neorhizobium turbinariae]
MRTKIIAGSVLIALAVNPATAADINAQGAAALQESLTGFLPEQVKKSDFLTVTPAGDRYEISYDFGKLIGTLGLKDFTVAGLTPFIMAASPLDNGQWKLNSDSDVNFSVSGKLPDGKETDVTYSVTDMVFSGIFDPAIAFMRSAAAMSGPIRMVSKSGEEELEASFAGMNYTLASVGSKTAGAIDFTGKGSFKNFYERIVAPETPEFEVRSQSLDFDVGVEGVTATRIRDLMSFILPLIKKDKPSPEEIARLKELFRDAMPFFTSLSEKLTFNEFKVVSPFGDFGLGKLDYMLTMTEPNASTRIGIGARIENVSAPSGILPEAYEQLVPDLAEIEIGLADLNISRFIDVLMEQDAPRPANAKDPKDDELTQAVLNDGQLTIDFPKILAKSSIYDVEASGKVKGYPDQKDRYSLEATILAGDFDKLIKHVQEMAKDDPDLNQTSLLMMMAKGIAKTEPDGRLRWDVRSADGKSLTVNGQVLQ